jgi:type I restriction enzyme R subunit
MFLTGFDATTLNTLWVDKNLKAHGLIQAFSRTNRILNSVKTFGNIVCFRNLDKATDEAVALFGNKEARGVMILRKYSDYYYGYKDGDKEFIGYEDLVNELLKKFPLGQMIIGENNQKEFIKLYGSILRIKNILSAFDEFEGNEILFDRDVQDYHSIYIDIYNEFKNTDNNEKESINDDIIFELELIKQVEINIDYIINLIKKYHESHTKDRELLIDINKSIDSSIELRNKKDLINEFISSLKIDSSVDQDWHKFVEIKKIEELNNIIEDEKLDKEATYNFINNAFSKGNISSSGVKFSNILPSGISIFDQDGARMTKRESVLTKLTNFFQRFFDISGNNSIDENLK